LTDNPRIFEPDVKESWQPSRVDELPFVLHRAWNQIGRRVLEAALRRTRATAPGPAGSAASG
jgi:hypothetical protein